MIEQAVILAGGKGTRLMPLTKDIPKPLVLVNKKPFLEWQLLFLQKQGTRRALLLVSHLADKIVDYFTQHPIPGLDITFSHETEALGTGGALLNAIEKLEDTFFVLNGDSFAPIRLKEMESEFRKKTSDICVAVLPAEKNMEVPGNMKITEGCVVEYKKEAGIAAGYPWIDAGVYIYNKSVLAKVKASGFFGIDKTWESSIQNKTMVVYKMSDPFFDIGTPDRLKFFEGKIEKFFDGE